MTRGRGRRGGDGDDRDPERLDDAGIAERAERRARSAVARPRPIAPPQPAGSPLTAPPANRPAASADQGDAEQGESSARTQRPGSAPRASRRPISSTSGSSSPTGGPISLSRRSDSPGARRAHPVRHRAGGAGVQRGIARMIGDQGDEGEGGEQERCDSAEEAPGAPREPLRAVAQLLEPAGACLSRASSVC